ncbi:hypothetical protein [Sphingosinicella sp. BN140058]|uniref:hypothetical protein n=1 Tax=Sphingosinicella sp. BN140058 TaxID=1892855 RepID=UPI0013ECD920|nr:hypothetical protein [Sphingosinicella sp. BN140058]
MDDLYNDVSSLAFDEGLSNETVIRALTDFIHSKNLEHEALDYLKRVAVGDI